MKKKYIVVKTHDAKPLSWWYSKRDKIDMSPSYQRKGGLWSNSDKAYLIDSIINEFDIPKIYMADFTWMDTPLNEKDLPYSIIDGKQRFEAIFEFFEGKLTLNDDFVFYDDKSKDLSGLGLKDIRQKYPEIAETFENYNLTVMSVYAKAAEAINNLFIRLNRSKSLTGAEIRNAMIGPLPGIIRKITQHSFMRDCINFQTKRSQDLNAAAKLIYFEYSGEIKETKKRNLDALVLDARNEDVNKFQVAYVKVNGVLDRMTEVFLPKDKLLSSSGLLPVYYWFIRSRSNKDLSKVRGFIQKFENDRKLNRQKEAEGIVQDKLNKDFQAYDIYNRSTNDLTSNIERVKILDKYFKKYVETT